jgi:RNA polymerase sigma factor (sigma-70 family)
MASDTSHLFMEHRRALVDYATRLVGSRSKAEDVVQEAWIRLNAAMLEHRTIAEPKAYLYRIVHNLAVDDRGAVAREGRIIKSAEVTEADQLSFSGPTPEGITLYRDELRRLQQAMAELPERTRIAFQMHRLGGFKLREIALHLRVSVPTAHKLVVDGLRHCRNRLEWPDGDESAS